MRQYDPNWTAIDQEFDVNRVGVPGGDSNNNRLINAVDFFFCPSVAGVEVFVHTFKTIANAIRRGQTRGSQGDVFYDVWLSRWLTADSEVSMKNLGILLSGRGSNFEAIARNIATGRVPDARIAIVISNRTDAGGIQTAKQLGLDASVVPSKGKEREQHDRQVVAILQQHKVDLVCLAGYMRLLSPWFVRQFPHRILNIHPSLLPAFPGLEAQEQAFAYGVKVSGCTVHFVDEELDHGPIIVQKAVPVLDSDDEHSLAARILEQEHIAYSEAINLMLSGRFEVQGRRFAKAKG